MRLKPSASVAPKLLTRTMSMSQFLEVIQYYQRLQAQLSRTTEVPEVSSVVNQAQPSTPAAVNGNTHDPSPRYATPEQVTVLKRLASRVSAEAAEDLQDVLDHSPNGLLMDVYQRIETRLQARLNGQKTIAVA
jgi:hypothetical protein